MLARAAGRAQRHRHRAVGPRDRPLPASALQRGGHQRQGPLQKVRQVGGLLGPLCQHCGRTDVTVSMHARCYHNLLCLHWRLHAC